MKSLLAWVRALFEFVATSILLIATGAVFSIMMVMLGKPELILLVLILLLACLIQSCFGEKTPFRYLQDFPLVGDATRILSSLLEFYRENPPRGILYYLFYPLTSVVGFWRTPSYTRGELGRYFILIHWILLILIVEGFFTIVSLAQVFDTRFALLWCLLEFILLYFLCNLFAIPCVVASIHFSLAGARRRLFCVAVLTCLALVGFYHHFSNRCALDSLIPVNTVLDRHLRPQDGSTPFLDRMREHTAMFLEHHMPALRESAGDEAKRTLAGMNEKYQEILSGMCLYGENRLFYFTTNQNPEDFWGIVCLPVRNSILLAFHATDRSLEIYSRWQDMPEGERERMAHRWNRDAYRPSRERQFARIILEDVKDLRDKLEEFAPQSQARKVSVAQESMQSSAPCLEAKACVESDAPANDFESSGMRAFGARQSRICNRWEEFARECENLESRGNLAEPELWNAALRLLGRMREFAGQPIPPSISAESLPSLLSQICEQWRPFWPVKLPEEIAGAAEDLRSFEFLLLELRRIREAGNLFLRQNDWEELEASCDRGERSLREKTDRPDYERMAESLRSLEEAFESYMRSTFVVYHEELASFRFERAIGMKLAEDHGGEGPRASEDDWESALWALGLKVALGLFAMVLPLHVSLIVVCYLRS